MAAAINYASTPLCGSGTLTTGDTSRTAPTTAVNLMTPASGAQIERISIVALATTVASVLRLFRYDGSAYHLYLEIPIAAQTITASGALSTQTLEAVTLPNMFPIIIPAGWSLRVTINDTQTGIKVNAEGGGY